MSNRLRIATFNLENWDDKPGRKPSLEERIAVVRPMLLRVRADVLCLQEVNGQEEEGQPRRLLALDRLLEGTALANCQRVTTTVSDGSQVYDERNLVICSRLPILESRLFRHDFAPAPAYRKVTASPPETEADEVTWERPLLYARLSLPHGGDLHVINVHLKSRLPSYVDGQKIGRYDWRSASGWAEGFFLSSLKRVGQALETRMFLDHLFDRDERAHILVCGDFNSESDGVPLEAIQGAVENTGNEELLGRVLVSCERSIPDSSRFSLYHHGRGVMLDHVLMSRELVAYYRGTEVHNELLHDESVGYSSDKTFPEPDHAPVVAEFELPPPQPGSVGPL